MNNSCRAGLNNTQQAWVVLFDTPVYSNRDDSKNLYIFSVMMQARFSNVPFYVDLAQFIVDLAKASMGSIHFLRRGSS